MSYKVRTAAKAVIIRDGKLLLTKNNDDFGVFYLLPGGGQEVGESILDALKRECLEEIGAGVVPGNLLFVRDYIGRNHEFVQWDRDFHQIELMFDCKLEEGANPGKGSLPDVYQSGVEWIPIAELEQYRVYPKALIEPLKAVQNNSFTIYLGDVN